MIFFFLVSIQFIEIEYSSNAERSIASMIVCLSLLAVLPVFKVQLKCDRILQNLSYYTSLMLM